MSYATTLKYMQWNYPSLFPQEVDALEHLFFVIGNGYEWRGGQLVNKFPKDNPIQSQIRLHEQHFGGLAWITQQPEFDDLRKEFDLFKADPYDPKPLWAMELKKREKDSYWKHRKIYPLCDYAKILRVPKNVQKGWLAAAWKALNLAQQGYWKLTVSDIEWLDKARKQLKDQGLTDPSKN